LFLNPKFILKFSFIILFLKNNNKLFSKIISQRYVKNGARRNGSSSWWNAWNARIIG
jgi:hypothetical protein